MKTPTKRHFFSTVAKLMIVEFVLGLTLGFSWKYAVQLYAKYSSDVRVFTTEEYSSLHFGKEFPSFTLNMFMMQTEIIAVRYENGEVIREDFITFLGESTRATYKNGKLEKYTMSAAASPVYLLTVIPLFIGGFMLAIKPKLQAELNFDRFTFFCTALLCSGLFWFLLHLFAKCYFALRNGSVL